MHLGKCLIHLILATCLALFFLSCQSDDEIEFSADGDEEVALDGDVLVDGDESLDGDILIDGDLPADGDLEHETEMPSDGDSDEELEGMEDEIEQEDPLDGDLEEEMLPEGRCRTPADCLDMEDCFYPGQQIGCGPCMEPENTCEADEECQNMDPDDGPWICSMSEIDDCLCESAMICKTGCTTETDCPPAFECDENHHCRRLSCDIDGDCPANFICPQSGKCHRISCTDDLDCPDAFCVSYGCYEQLGSCGTYPP